jgi:hypothetical protein
MDLMSLILPVILYSLLLREHIESERVMTKRWLHLERSEQKKNGFERVILKKAFRRITEIGKVYSIYAVLIVEPIIDRTRFSMLTGDRAESSIHDFIPEREDISGDRDLQIAELKAQLDNVLEHVYFPG